MRKSIACALTFTALFGTACQRGTVTPPGTVLLEKDTTAFLTGESKERATRATSTPHSQAIKTGTNNEVEVKIDTTTATDDRGGMWIKAVKVTVVSNQDYEIQTVLSEKAIINTGTVEKPKVMLMMPITYLRHAGGGAQVGTKMVQIVGDGQIVEM